MPTYKRKSKPWGAQKYLQKVCDMMICFGYLTFLGNLKLYQPEILPRKDLSEISAWYTFHKYWLLIIYIPVSSFYILLRIHNRLHQTSKIYKFQTTGSLTCHLEQHEMLSIRWYSSDLYVVKFLSLYLEKGWFRFFLLAWTCMEGLVCVR